MALAITARVSIPGSRKSSRSWMAGGKAPSETEAKKASSAGGITSVTSTASPRRKVSSSSMRACARTRSGKILMERLIWLLCRAAAW